VDSFHASAEEPSVEEAYRRAGDRLFHVHIADSDRQVPGFGHLAFDGIWRALMTIRYSGAVVLECYPRPSADAMIAAGRGIRGQWASACRQNEQVRPRNGGLEANPR
jgi:sugar phosphate isomerase/epimerase